VDVQVKEVLEVTDRDGKLGEIRIEENIASDVDRWRRQGNGQ